MTQIHWSYNDRSLSDRVFPPHSVWYTVKPLYNGPAVRQNLPYNGKSQQFCLVNFFFFLSMMENSFERKKLFVPSESDVERLYCNIIFDVIQHMFYKSKFMLAVKLFPRGISIFKIFFFFNDQLFFITILQLRLIIRSSTVDLVS